jgi:hypothetical protein
VLNLEAEQGGRLPGFDGTGSLAGSGRFTGQTAHCDDFDITLRGKITEGG